MAQGDQDRIDPIMDTADRVSGLGRVVREFFVDILGSFVPGFVYTVAAGSLFWVSLLYVRHYVSGPPAGPPPRRPDRRRAPF